MSSLQVVYEDFSTCCKDFIQGVEHLNERSIPQAIESFQLAYDSVACSDTYHSKYEAYCGLAKVLSGDRSGLEMCRHAALNELEDGDVFLNLARAELHYHNRKRAIIALKKGLMLDNRHPGLRDMRSALGVRNRCSLPFLPRSHPLNHALGTLLRGKSF